MHTATINIQNGAMVMNGNGPNGSVVVTRANENGRMLVTTALTKSGNTVMSRYFHGDHRVNQIHN